MEQLNQEKLFLLQIHRKHLFQEYSYRKGHRNFVKIIVPCVSSRVKYNIGSLRIRPIEEALLHPFTHLFQLLCGPWSV